MSDGYLRRIPVAAVHSKPLPLDTGGTFDSGDDETILLARGGIEPIRRVARRRSIRFGKSPG